tara:strand:+ start:957 stop:1118 length:162 start_codon:yes stop_codon:yes gene_type:complete
MRMPIILCDCCSSKAIIYQWDKWLCYKHWTEERDRHEEKEQQYQQLIKEVQNG